MSSLEVFTQIRKKLPFKTKPRIHCLENTGGAGAQFYFL
jgi:hypothetical protein